MMVWIVYFFRKILEDALIFRASLKRYAFYILITCDHASRLTMVTFYIRYKKRYHVWPLTV
jgi:hypothetical protein